MRQETPKNRDTAAGGIDGSIGMTQGPRVIQPLAQFDGLEPGRITVTRVHQDAELFGDHDRRHQGQRARHARTPGCSPVDAHLASRYRVPADMRRRWQFCGVAPNVIRNVYFYQVPVEREQFSAIEMHQRFQARHGNGWRGVQHRCARRVPAATGDFCALAA